MNKKQATEKGFLKTGSYSREKSEIQEELDSFKKLGYKGAVVIVKDSPLSKGSVGVGYSLFLEEKYFTDRDLEEAKEKLSRIVWKKQKALERYEKELKEIEDEEDTLKKLLNI